jgi:nitrate reductase delta subunit
MSVTYKILSALLSYPSESFQAAADELIAALEQENLLPRQQVEELSSLIRQIAAKDIFEVQANYVDLFDRTRSLSLHLFEHVHGESRDRGPAMVSLRERYRQGGFDITANELPDYLPLFLEFLSLQSAGEACALLAEPMHIVAALAERLKKRGSTYAAAFEALVSLAQAQPDAGILSNLREVEIENPHDLAALDRAWEETEVRFGPGDAKDGDCPRAGQMLRAMESGKTTITQERTNP